MFIIMLGWVFFRSPDMPYALGFLSRLVGNRSGITQVPFSQTAPFPFIEPSFVLVTLIALLFSLPIISIWKSRRQSLEGVNSRRYFFLQTLEDTLLVGIFILAIAAHVAGAFAPNIYAKF